MLKPTTQTTAYRSYMIKLLQVHTVGRYCSHDNTYLEEANIEKVHRIEIIWTDIEIVLYSKFCIYQLGDIGTQRSDKRFKSISDLLHSI